MSERKNASPVSEDSTSSSLLGRARSQDAAAWQRLVDLYGPLVYQWCRRQHLRPEDRADVFQEVFRAVATHLQTFRMDRPGDTFRGWLLTITHNKIRDHFRRRQQQVQAVGGSDPLWQLAHVADPVAGQEEASDAVEQSAFFRRALQLIWDEFEDRTWEAFWRVVVDGQASADVAAALGISLNAVYKAKSRVLQRLRQELSGLLE
jgi:RNA polymerase sigma-70 factor (ECF subfamily)